MLGLSAWRLKGPKFGSCEGEGEGMKGGEGVAVCEMSQAWVVQAFYVLSHFCIWEDQPVHLGFSASGQSKGNRLTDRWSISIFLFCLESVEPSIQDNSDSLCNVLGDMETSLLFLP